jgi:hypothetical protein
MTDWKDALWDKFYMTIVSNAPHRVNACFQDPRGKYAD